MNSLDVDPRERDGLLAAGATAALIAFARARDYPLDRVASPRPLAAGAAGALALELAMALAPDRARALWGRRSVRWTGTLLVAAGGPALALLAGPAVVAALLGGLVAYFCLLAGVQWGVVPPPESWFYDDAA
ncbi:hypothetical protein [Candidatus Halobonum tyrrellensis]|uniref:Uncharacterized protein n=1 Tax=Candidatus Halobonum tyrrellensis G22 TaxID=1324957 RepID=V4HA91_9EURY|nr:hypothetical protein [Candidatus Halobonum tyrrellensis]ESP87630.1 hypothetical protein K933_12967 [Candidatus Halobonum tyrrellensis G22]